MVSNGFMGNPFWEMKRRFQTTYGNLKNGGDI